MLNLRYNFDRQTDRQTDRQHSCALFSDIFSSSLFKGNNGFSAVLSYFNFINKTVKANL